MLSAEQIESNWNLFLENIKTYISGDRRDKLLEFYDKYANRIAVMPASGKVNYHNAFAGGYIDHVNRVLNLSFKVAQLWNSEGAQTGYSDEELAFVAINHDLGKFGDLDHEEYLQETEDYWIKKGQVYKHNPDISFMKTSERSLFLLQQIGIPMTQTEYLGIRLHDGLYEEGNKSYYMSFSEEYRLRSNLPYIVHQADMLATRIEHDGASNVLQHPFNLVKEPSNVKVDNNISIKKSNTKLPGIDDNKVITSKPLIVKDNSSKPEYVKRRPLSSEPAVLPKNPSKYSSMLKNL